MPSPATPIVPSAESQKIILKFVVDMATMQSQIYNMRGRLEDVDRSYMREVDFSVERWKADKAKRRGDITKFHNIVIPVVMPQVESAVTFQSEMFLSGFPIFGVVSSPKYIDQALQMDTIIGDQQLRGGWVQEFQKAFRNGFKHNLMATETDWAQVKTFSIGSADNSSVAQLQEIVWEGNRIVNMDLYNTLFDPRVAPDKIATDGEFAGYMKLYSRVALKQFMNSLVNGFNAKEALNSGLLSGMSVSATSPATYYFPRLNPEALILPDSIAGTSWNTFWTGQEARLTRDEMYKTNYQVTVVYAKICPADLRMFNVPAPTVPQNWKFILVNNQVVIYAERLTNAHQFLPMVFSQPYDDGLTYQTKSLAVNVGDIQEIVTAHANSSIAARRRAVSDRGIYDPSLINASAINNDNPTAKIPVKPSAFGGDVSKAYYPIPFRDDQFQVNTAEMQQYLGFANIISGMNPARQGQFVKGNKTRAEFDNVMNNGSGRDKTVSQSIEASHMAPTKEIIKANILQYQGGVSLFNPDKEKVVEIDPVQLRTAMLSFKLADGMLPSERIMDGEALTMALQTIQAVPALASGFNVVPMFSYMLKTRGAKLSSFEKPPEQLAYEQAVGQWQQTMAQLAAEVSKLKDVSPETLQQLTSKLPPMPAPQQFGYNPQQANPPEPTESIINQVARISSQGGTVPTGQQNANS